MEEFETMGINLSKAINEGNVEEALRLIQKAVTLDAEFEVYVEPKGMNREDEPMILSDPELNRIDHEKSEKIKYIYEKLKEMGVDEEKARNLANTCSSIDEAINNSFLV